MSADGYRLAGLVQKLTTDRNESDCLIDFIDEFEDGALGGRGSARP
jgi:hypothetical protein